MSAYTRLRKTDPDRAARISEAVARVLKATRSGVVSVVLDDDGRVHVLPGPSFELVAVYDEHVTPGMVADDLLFLDAE